MNENKSTCRKNKFYQYKKRNFTEMNKEDSSNKLKTENSKNKKEKNFKKFKYNLKENSGSRSYSRTVKIKGKLNSNNSNTNFKSNTYKKSNTQNLTTDENNQTNSEFRLETVENTGKNINTNSINNINVNVNKPSLPKKKIVKSSEEIILEEMAKHKFSAKPLKKSLFSSSVERKLEYNLPNNNNIVNTFNISNTNLNNLDNRTDSKEIKKKQFSENLKKININTSTSYLNNPNPVIKNNISNTHNIKENTSTHNNNIKTYSHSVNKSENNNIQNNNNIIENTHTNNIHSKVSFKANPLPNFTFFEVKKSISMLTVPRSPKLHTKSRSLKKIGKI